MHSTLFPGSTVRVSCGSVAGGKGVGKPRQAHHFQDGAALAAAGQRAVAGAADARDLGQLEVRSRLLRVGIRTDGAVRGAQAAAGAVHLLQALFSRSKGDFTLSVCVWLRGDAVRKAQAAAAGAVHPLQALVLVAICGLFM